MNRLVRCDARDTAALVARVAAVAARAAANARAAAATRGQAPARGSRALLVAYGVADCYARVARIDLSVLSELRVGFEPEEVRSEGRRTGGGAKRQKK